MPPETLVDTQEIESLREAIQDLNEQLNKRHTELMVALNAKDVMQAALKVESVDATKWRAIKALAIALSAREE